MFIAHDHTNYAQYVHVQLIILINVSDTHGRCKELLEQNGFSVSQSLVLCLRNTFDITIRQTINSVPSQSRYYRLQQLELRFILQMEWCITHHIRAQYVETTPQCIRRNIQSTQMQSRTSTRGLQFLASPILIVPVEADDIGRKAVADFIDSF